jgi:phosphoglycolate phosphatase
MPAIVALSSAGAQAVSVGSRTVDLAADAVLFDLDGTLVDSRVPFVRSVNAALTEHELPARAPEELHPYLGPPLHQTFSKLGAGRLTQACVDAYRRRYRTHGVGETEVFAGVVDMLERLAAHATLLVATSKSLPLARLILDGVGLSARFVAIEGPELATLDEPKAVTIARALTRVPESRRPVMVGDRCHDVVGARANDIPAVGVLWGVGSREELASADVLVERPDDLARLTAPL